MSADNEIQEETKTELQMLKERADRIGLKYGPNIGVDTLKAKLEEAMNPTAEPEKELSGYAAAQADRAKLLQKMRDDALKLVRIRVTNMDPNKKNMEGELFTFQNDVLGKVTKYVPFGEKTEDGYHVPNCIYNLMRTKKFIQIKRKINKATGQPIISTKMVNQFSIEVLPQLTEAERKQLGTAQLAAGSMED